MNVNQIKILNDSYKKEATRPDGSKSTMGEYMRFITDCNLEFVSSKDMVLCDDTNEVVHCVCVNEDAYSQANFPVKIITSPYEDIHAVEAIMSKDNFEKFLDEGFLSQTNGWSDAKKEFMKKWVNGLKIQAQQLPYATPLHTNTAGIVSMPNIPHVRNDGITTITSGVSSASKIITSVEKEEEVFEAIKAGKSIILTKDITLSAECLELKSDISINLNGHTLVAPAGNKAINITGGNVSIDNGTIEGNGNVTIYMNSIADDGCKPCTLTLGKDVVINTNHCGVFIKGPNSVLNTSAIINTVGSYGAIQGNGNEKSGGVTINVTGGELTSEQSAIYFPCKTLLTISGGAKITGYTGVYCKSGRMVINDATIIGNGDKVDYVFNSNGCNSTGDAIVIEACKYPGGVPIVNIIDGTFISKNASAVAYYQQSDKYKLANEKFITGGTFNTDVSKLIADGYTQNSEGKVIKNYMA